MNVTIKPHYFMNKYEDMLSIYFTCVKGKDV